MNKRQLASRILTTIGGIGTAVGAIDPLEGSLLILPGSVLMALGTFLGADERQVKLYRLGGCLALVIGAVTLHLSAQFGAHGGYFGGRPAWWGAVFLLAFVGWSALIWGPGSPRWLCCLGGAIGLQQLAFGVLLAHTTKHLSWLGYGAIGLVTIAGCIYRLLHQPSR